MNTHTLANGVIELQFKDKKFKVKKLSLLDIFGVFEQQIKEEYMSNIAEMSKMVPENQRSEFVKSSIKEFPSGKKLEDAVNDRMDTTQGGISLLYTILNKCQSVSRDDIVQMATDKEASVFVQSVVSFALDQEMPDAMKEETEKKTVTTVAS